MKIITLTTTLFFCLSLSLLSAQDPLPEVTIKTLEGQSIMLKEALHEGKTTILSFWATWCAPCKKELDAISEIYDEWQEKFNAELIAISVDDARATAKIKPMVAQKGWPYRIFVDSNQELMRSLHFQSVPYTVVVNAKGNIVYTHTGYLPGDELELENELASLVD